jgi:hypothetical protein
MTVSNQCDKPLQQIWGDVWQIQSFASQLWNDEESSLQTGQNGGAPTIISYGQRQLHRITFDVVVHISNLSCIYVSCKGNFPNSYIFKRKQFRWNFMKHCKIVRVWRCDARSGWSFILILGSEMNVSSIFCMQALDVNMYLRSRHLLIMDSHNSNIIMREVSLRGCTIYYVWEPRAFMTPLKKPLCIREVICLDTFGYRCIPFYTYVQCKYTWMFFSSKYVYCMYT